MAYKRAVKQSKKDKAKDAEVLARIKQRFEMVRDKDGPNRQNQREDTEFVYKKGAQWPEKTRKQRSEAGDPVMEFPQLKQFISQVVNDQRQNRPGVRVHPASGDASKDVAGILQGLIRGIEYDSRAESVYDCGYQHSVVGGRGYWRIVSEYESPKSFNQKLLIKRIADPLTVDLDPDYQDPDGGDREWGFVSEVMQLEEFKAKFPEASVVSWSADDVWHPSKDEIIVADYYERVCETKTLVQLVDGTSVLEDELPQGAQIETDAKGKPVTRETEVYRVVWYTIAGGDQILETHDWPGSIIPIVCAMGDEVVIDGVRTFQGLVTQAKDTQTLFNFGMTQQAIHLSVQPRAPFLAAKEAIAGHEGMWANANSANYSTLIYNAFAEDDTTVALPIPQRQPAGQLDSGWLNWTQQMQMLLKSIIGMYENTLGMKGQEVSGKAIKAREMQGDNATFHFLDNFSRAISLTGRILLECIPTYYDTERIVHIIGPDDLPARKKVNEQQVAVDPQDPTGALRAVTNNDLTTGEYAVTVEAGPGYATKRQEAADLMMQLIQAYPPLMQFASDIIVGLQDIPDVDLLVERCKAMAPPPIQAMIQAKAAEQDPQLAAAMKQLQDLQQQAQQMQQQYEGQIGQLTNQLQQEKDDKSASIAASNARQQIAEASGANAQQDAELQMQLAMMKRMDEQEKRAIERDKVFVDLLKVLQTATQPVQQQGPEATQALAANP